MGWRLADNVGVTGACACAEATFAEHRPPSALNPNQGSVFNTAAYQGLQTDRRVLQSTHGKARWVDNAIVERWFRSLRSGRLEAGKYETLTELRRLVVAYGDQYIDARRHRSLGYEAPAQWRHPGLMSA